MPLLKNAAKFIKTTAIGLGMMSFALPAEAQVTTIKETLGLDEMNGLTLFQPSVGVRFTSNVDGRRRYDSSYGVVVNNESMLPKSGEIAREWQKNNHSLGRVAFGVNVVEVQKIHTENGETREEQLNNKVGLYVGGERTVFSQITEDRDRVIRGSFVASGFGLVYQYESASGNYSTSLTYLPREARDEVIAQGGVKARAAAEAQLGNDGVFGVFITGKAGITTEGKTSLGITAGAGIQLNF